MEKTVEKLNSVLETLENKASPINKYPSSHLKYGILKIIYALKNNTPAVVYGDYDADGVLSSVMMYIYIKKIKEKLGIKSKTDIVFSDRNSFFGMGKNLYNRLSKDYGLIIMTDNGSMEEFLTKNTDNLLIIDHHPAVNNYEYIINPNINTDIYSTSAGKVMFDFLRALDANIKNIFNVSLMNKDSMFYRLFKQLSAITLISDMAALTKSNREFIKSALDLMKERELPVFSLLRDINSTEISFNIVSKINAVSRMEKDLSVIVKWFFPKSREEFNYADKKINEINNRKKEIVLDIYNSIPVSEFNKNIVTIYKEDMPPGLSGLLANKILSEYNKPAIIAARHNGWFVGSARGKEIKNFFNSIREKEKNFFKTGNYGGHMDAMGFRTQSLNDLKLIEKYIKNFRYIEKFSILTDRAFSTDEFSVLDKIYKERAKGVNFSMPLNVFVKIPFEKADKKEYKNYIRIGYNGFETLLDRKTYSKAVSKPLAVVSMGVSKLADVKGFINEKNDIIYDIVLENTQKCKQNVKNQKSIKVKK